LATHFFSKTRWSRTFQPGARVIRCNSQAALFGAASLSGTGGATVFLFQQCIDRGLRDSLIDLRRSSAGSDGADRPAVDLDRQTALIGKRIGGKASTPMSPLLSRSAAFFDGLP